VPQRAVSELQGGYLVAVIGKDNKVNIRPIKVGSKVDTMWIVDEGLKPGERIVAEGFQKVRENMEVQPQLHQSCRNREFRSDNTLALCES